jgi:D-alanyl-lipoteichoic acid acyltransferase DltB (MBOAT superfamily)
MINFNRPLIARSLRDFWNRWHISLTTWFREYLLYSLPYIKGRKVVYAKLYRNLIITFLIMGLWHGAAWTFVIFGLFHGVLLVLETITENQRQKFYELTRINEHPVLKNALGMLTTFSILVFSLTFFRAKNLGDSMKLLSNAFDFRNFRESLGFILKDYEVLFGMLMVIILMIAEYLHDKYNLVRFISSKPILIRWTVYIGFIFFILLFGVLQKQKFIYFQF